MGHFLPFSGRVTFIWMSMPSLLIMLLYLSRTLLAILLDIHPEKWDCWLLLVLLLIFLRDLTLFYTVTAPFYIPNGYTSVPISPHPHQYMLL